MGKTVESPKKFIISCRVDDRELELLQHLAEQAGINLSTLLRRSIEELQSSLQPQDHRLSA